MGTRKEPTMDCEQALPMMQDLLDGDLEASPRQRLEQHLQSCPGCARRYEEMCAVERWAGQVRPVSPGRDFTERVMAQIVEEKSAPAVLPPAVLIVGLIAVAVAALIVPIATGGTGWAERWDQWAVEPAGTLLDAVVGGVGQSLREGFSGVVTVLGLFERLGAFRSSLWLPSIAATAFVLIVVFNVVQARVAVREK